MASSRFQRRGARRPRVLHVSHSCLPHIGGLETVLAVETRGLLARGWDVATVTASGSVGPGVREEDGVRTVRVRAWNGLEQRFGVPFPVFTPHLLRVMLGEVRRADLVHVHDPLYLTSWAAMLWCLLLGTPYVLHRHVGVVHHSSFVVRLVQRVVIGSVGRLALRRAQAVLPIDEHIAAGTRPLLADPTRVHVLANGVDTERFRPATADERRQARRALGLPEDRPLALFVGRFVPKKGFAAVAAAASDHYDIVFAGGDRPTGTDDPRLHFLGGRPAEEMPTVYRCADAMVVASVGESPLTVVEAMSSGLPVLVNDDPSLRSSPWTAGPGVRFVDIAEGGLRRAAEELLGDASTAQRMGVEARAHVEASFSWSAHLDRLEEVYRGVLASRVSLEASTMRTREGAA